MKFMRKSVLVAFLALILAGTPQTGRGAESGIDGFLPEDVGVPKRLSGGGTRGISIRPESEVRSVIREADGYAYLGEDNTIKEVRRIALMEAKRAVLEGTETYIESKSKVTDGMLDFDIIESSAGGKVTVLEKKDHGFKDGRYHVWIKAEVKFGVKRPNNAPAVADGRLLQDPGGPLTVRTWTEKKRFADGEEITIFLMGNRDFYARVVDFMSDGTIVQLLPNTYRTNNHFKGGVAHRIPDLGQGDQFKLTVAPPFGVDRIVVYASDVQLGQVATNDIGNGMRLYRGSATQLSKATRGLDMGAGERKKGPNPKNAEFIESAWEIHTSGR